MLRRQDRASVSFTHCKESLPAEVHPAFRDSRANIFFLFFFKALSSGNGQIRPPRRLGAFLASHYHQTIFSLSPRNRIASPDAGGPRDRGKGIGIGVTRERRHDPQP
jgi:hypothetical protein